MTDQDLGSLLSFAQVSVLNDRAVFLLNEVTQLFHPLFPQADWFEEASDDGVSVIGLDAHDGINMWAIQHMGTYWALISHTNAMLAAGETLEACLESMISGVKRVARVSRKAAKATMDAVSTATMDAVSAVSTATMDAVSAVSTATMDAVSAVTAIGSGEPSDSSPVAI